MRLFVALLTVVAAAAAASIASDYLPPVADNSLPIQEYIAPEANDDSVALANDGYRYKVVRKLKHRLRRDVSELPVDEYLPPTEDIEVAATEPEIKTQLADDGYRYKTIRRLKYRHRRDVSDLPANEYLPPTEVQQPVSEDVSVIESVPEVKTELAEDGYRYKTVRRLKYRHRRDVNELPANEYLPPTEVEPAMSEEVSIIESAPEVKTELAEDGYRYKTVRRLKYRHRRDVSELPANEYLPPTEVEQSVSEEASLIEPVPEVRTVLAEDGYRYKTVRRLKYRHRRDVNELPANDYLPPTEVEQPLSEELSVMETVPEVKTKLADDGYRYKIVRRLKYRHRRDVNELPVNEYLPPTEIEQPVSEEVSIIETVPELKTELAEDGYRYKTVRRLKYRHRRDVSEKANIYLPLNLSRHPLMKL